MIRKRIVVALGGNALGNTLPEQMAAVKETSHALVDLIEEGHQVVIVHGNGPQVGMINQAMGALTCMLYRVPDNENFMERVAELIDLNVMRIATKNTVSVQSGSELDEACRLMADKRIKKAPVVDQDGVLVGSISRSDIVRATMANLTAIQTMAGKEQNA